MDMHQKRKMRAEKKIQAENEKGFPKISISCADLIYGNFLKDIEISRFL